MLAPGRLRLAYARGCCAFACVREFFFSTRAFWTARSHGYLKQAVPGRGNNRRETRRDYCRQEAAGKKHVPKVDTTALRGDVDKAATEVDASEPRCPMSPQGHQSGIFSPHAFCHRLVLASSSRAPSWPCISPRPKWPSPRQTTAGEWRASGVSKQRASVLAGPNEIGLASSDLPFQQGLGKGKLGCEGEKGRSPSDQSCNNGRCPSQPAAPQRTPPPQANACNGHRTSNSCQRWSFFLVNIFFWRDHAMECREYNAFKKGPGAPRPG